MDDCDGEDGAAAGALIARGAASDQEGSHATNTTSPSSDGDQCGVWIMILCF
jgi:hypothetical protein